MPRPIPLALLILALVLPACCSPQPTARDTPRHNRDLPAPEVARFFATEDGRETLRLLDEGDTRIYYDGHDRFVQISTIMAPAFGGDIPHINMHCGWMHPDYAVKRGLMIAGADHDDIQLTFTDDALRITITTPDAEPREYNIAWRENEMPQGGWIDLTTNRLSLLPSQ